MHPVWRLLKRLKIELTYNPAIPLLGILMKKTIKKIKIHMYIYIYIAMFLATLFIIAKIWKPCVYQQRNG